jgi:transcriptional regulator with XRE-family HTH domain
MERITTMPLAEKLCQLREAKGMSLDELATKAKISKTYLWELERDTAGVKKPSADVLLRIANALSTTLAELLSLATVRVEDGSVQLPPALLEFRDRMAASNTPLSANDLRDLAVMKFRGGQPETADEWHQLYLFLVNTLRRQKL